MDNALKSSISENNLAKHDQDSISISSQKSTNLAENVNKKMTTINRSLTYLDQIYEEIGSSFSIRYIFTLNNYLTEKKIHHCNKKAAKCKRNF